MIITLALVKEEMLILGAFVEEKIKQIRVKVWFGTYRFESNKDDI